MPHLTSTYNPSSTSTHQLVSASNPQTYTLNVSYGDWGKIQQYDLSQTDLANNVTTSQTRYYSYGSLNEGQTAFAPNNITDNNGTAVTDPNGHTSTTLKDADGRQWATKVAGQPWLYCDYSPVGDLMQVYSSNNGDWSRAYEYDWLGRRTSYNEDNLATYYTYDGLNPATETHKWQENGQPKQKKITCRYIAHRLDSVIYSDSTLPTVYSYDYAGRVASVLDESGRMDYAYGSMGEITAETRTYALPFLATDLALTTQYEYDSWGRTTSIT